MIATLDRLLSNRSGALRQRRIKERYALFEKKSSLFCDYHGTRKTGMSLFLIQLNYLANHLIGHISIRIRDFLSNKPGPAWGWLVDTGKLGKIIELFQNFPLGNPIKSLDAVAKI
jgi:hypothetical protein